MTPERSSLRTVLGRVAAWLIMAVTLLVGSAAPASAHAYLERTNPADGSVIQRAPDRLALYFSEHVVLEATTIEVVDGDGRVIKLDGLALETDEPDDTEAPAVVTASLPDLPRDAYRVRWSTLSSDDLHRTSGLFVFGVATQVLPTPFSEPTPRGSESGLRWLLLLGLALALGSRLIERLAPIGTARLGRVRAAGLLGAGTAVVVSLALMADQLLAGGLSWSELTGSGYAERWSLREAGLLLVVLGVASTRSRARGPALVLGAMAAAAGSALLGHAGADPGSAYTRVIATSVHLLAMLTWSGGVLCLVVLLVPAKIRRAGQLEVRALLRAFGGPAATCLGLGVATGLYLSSSTVVSVDAALRTTYGRTLLIKVALVAVMVLLALANHRRLRGRHDLDLPRRGVLAEATAAVLVLGATAFLTSAQPATESLFLTPPVTTTGPVSGDVADLHVAVDVAPNLPGVNVVSIDVFDTRRPAPSQVTAVALTIDGVATSAAPLGDGRWTVAGVDLSAGTRSLRVTATRPGLPGASIDTSWTVGSGSGGYQPVVSTAPVRAPLRVLAALVLTIWLLGLVVLRQRRRNGPDADGSGVSRDLPGPRPRRRSEEPLPNRSPAP
jgi:copper transport protein